MPPDVPAVIAQDPNDAQPSGEFAYVVDVRPLDDCAVPNCTIRGRNVFGHADEVQYDGAFGSYVHRGKIDSEQLFRRGVLLRPGERYEFEVPPSEAASVLEFSLSAAASGAYRSKMTILALEPARPAVVVDTRIYEGDTRAFTDRATNAEMAQVHEYEREVRIPLPDRAGRVLRVVFENTGASKLALGSPLVLKKVYGRSPRQAFVVIFDCVPYYILDGFFTGTNDPPTEIFSRMTAERGLYFPHGYSPAHGTNTFVRRFFRGGFYNFDGEPHLGGPGFDEDPPERSASLVARLAEQGFRTEQFAANYVISPKFASQGVDGGYQNETLGWPTRHHPEVLARRFDEWLSARPHDDVWAVVWISSTHDEDRLNFWPPGRKPVPAPTPPGLTPPEFRTDGVEARWENLLDSAGAIRKVFESAARHSPNAERLWLVTADHGIIQSKQNEGRSFRYPTHILHGPLHRFWGSAEETRTPFSLIYDGSASPPGGARVVPGWTQSMVFWRAVERLFHLDVGLPETSSFDSPALSPSDYERRWADPGVFAIGSSGGLRNFDGERWAYRAYRPKLFYWNMWEVSARDQRMLGGSDRAGLFVAEELYDDVADPYERQNLADAHPDVVLEMRKRTQDFYSTHHDPADHPRHRYVLTFPETVDVTLEGPRPFKVSVEGEPVRMQDPRRVSVRARRVEITEGDDAMAIVSVRGPGVASPMLLRCASSGQPLDELTASRDRLDLAVARTNCVVAKEGKPPAGEIWFSAELVRSKAAGAFGAAKTSGEALDAFKRWGYVRDIEPGR